MMGNDGEAGKGQVIERIDTSKNGVISYFAKTPANTRLLTFLLELDRLDVWAVDYDGEDAPSGAVIEVNALIDRLRKLVEQYVGNLHETPTELIDVLAILTTSRCVYLIKFVSLHNPQFVDKLGDVLEQDTSDNPNIAIVRRRLEIFNRAKLLSEIFSHERLQRIAKIMGSYDDV